MHFVDAFRAYCISTVPIRIEFNQLQLVSLCWILKSLIVIDVSCTEGNCNGENSNDHWIEGYTDCEIKYEDGENKANGKSIWKYEISYLYRWKSSPSCTRTFVLQSISIKYIPYNLAKPTPTKVWAQKPPLILLKKKRRLIGRPIFNPYLIGMLNFILQPTNHDFQIYLFQLVTDYCISHLTTHNFNRHNTASSVFPL